MARLKFAEESLGARFSEEFYRGGRRYTEETHIKPPVRRANTTVGATKELISRAGTSGCRRFALERV